MAASLNAVDLCRAQLIRGTSLDANGFLQWFREWKGDGGWIKEKDDDGRTTLYLALLHNVPDQVTLALLAASAGAATERNAYGNTILYVDGHCFFVFSLHILREWRNSSVSVREGTFAALLIVLTFLNGDGFFSH